MKRFNLDEWLKDRSKKVYIANGMEARIIYLGDIKNGDYDEAYYTSYPVLANVGGWLYQCDKDGSVEQYNWTPQERAEYALYFEIDDVKLTTFEERVKDTVMTIGLLTTENVRYYSNLLLEEAKKELAKKNKG
jgi:hypothetical protein